jgi:hypothetical protein
MGTFKGLINDTKAYFLSVLVPCSAQLRSGQFHLDARLEMGGAIASVHPYAFTACIDTSFPSGQMLLDLIKLRSVSDKT